MTHPDSDEQDFAATVQLDTGDGGDATAGDGCTRIVRVMLARTEGSAMDALFAARRRVNGEGGIPGLSGAVLYVNGWYVLWQEGPQQAVEAALHAVPRRKRHEPPRLIHRSVGARTLTEPLALSSTQWTERPEPFLARLDQVTAEAERLEPQQIWRAFSEPSTLEGTSALEFPRRVALLASEGQKSVEIARRLADRCETALVYRRFAGAEPGSSDFGAAYLDTPSPDGGLRVLAVSRRAFGHRLVHESLAHADRLVLVAGRQPSKATELGEGVAEFLHRTGLRPAIDLIAEEPEAGAALAASLQHASVPLVEHDPDLSDTRLLVLLRGAAGA